VADKPHGASITKKEAVQQALTELGRAAKAADLQQYAKEKFGLDISANLAKEYKGDLVKKLLPVKGPAGKKPAASKPAMPAKPAPQASPVARGIPLKDILTIKELVGRLGAKPLHVLIDAFAE
jgi:hypothetical protein